LSVGQRADGGSAACKCWPAKCESQMKADDRKALEKAIKQLQAEVDYWKNLHASRMANERKAQARPGCENERTAGLVKPSVTVRTARKGKKETDIPATFLGAGATED